MKQQQQQHHQINLLDDNSINNNKFSVNKNRNSLPVYSFNSTNCYLCMRNLPVSPSLIMIVNDHYYHRDCFKCTRCDRYLNENEAHTLIEHKYLYCGNCFIKRKPLQSKSQTDSNQQRTTVSLSNTNNNNLNELKLKFESVQKNNTLNSLKYSNLNKISNPTTTTMNNSNNDFYMTNNNNNNNYQTVGLSFSSSSSSSNFSLSPSSSSSWSSSNNSGITNSIHNNNAISQINQRITMLNNISLQNQRATNENANKTKRLITNLNNLEITPTKPVNQNQNNRNETISLPMTPVLNLKRNDSKKTIFSSNQNSPKISSTSKELAFYSQPAESDNKNKNVKTSSNIAQVNNTDSNLLPFKQHTSKCNIILRKTRRGNKRSKSLPSKFNVDSLLDYLNCSMLINKYELKKLNHQRNMLLSTNSSNNILIYNSKNRYKQLLNYNNNYYKNQQFSSGYNSENYSNSSNSTTNGVTTICASSSFLTNKNMINFYRLSLSHLPLHFLNLQCTCGASNINNSIDMSRLNEALQSSSSSSIGCFRHSNIENLKSSSPNNKFEEFNVEYDEDDEEEEDEDEEDDDEEEEDLDEELNQNISIDENILNQTATNLNQIEANQNNNNNNTQIKKHNEANDIRFQFSNCLQRAPGTSHCQHTVRVDIRRVRSLIDLSHLQYIYSPNDFIFKEKLGEGFFANVKKIISKQTNKTMVLKELKLSCISSMNSNNENLSSSINSESDSKLDESLNSLARGDFLINYAELNAAYKSFLKEAQVLRNLNHPNVIKLMGIMFTKEKHLNLILEYISGGTLKDIIHNISNVLPWKLRVGYAKDIAAAMEYLHSLNIIHRDLKSDNCLVRENGRTVVVADFGLSRINTIQASAENNPMRTIKNRNDSFNLSLFRLPNSFLASNNSYVQSPQSSSSATNSFIVAAKRKLKRHNHTRKPRYAVVGNSFSMAPEMLNHQIYDERVDIFSFGIICCEIIGRVQADPDYLPRTSDFGLNVELFRKKYCEADCPKHFIKIAIACCELEPDKRPPFTKTHLWLETILSHLETNNPIPKNLLKNILDQNTKRPLSSLINSNNENQQLLQSKI